MLSSVVLSLCINKQLSSQTLPSNTQRHTSSHLLGLKFGPLGLDVFDGRLDFARVVALVLFAQLVRLQAQVVNLLLPGVDFILYFLKDINQTLKMQTSCRGKKLQMSRFMT